MKTKAEIEAQIKSTERAIAGVWLTDGQKKLAQADLADLKRQAKQAR